MLCAQSRAAHTPQWTERLVLILRVEVSSDKTTETKIRNAAIEEVARAVEKFKGSFGPDTVASFAVYIRGLKR